MRPLLPCLVLSLLCGPSLPSSAGDLTFKMQNGRVTILAQDVPVRQILEEWARVGHVRIVNVEKLAGAPVSLMLVDVPESKALDTLLRSAGGYLAAPRATPVIGASLYDRIMIMPTSRPPAVVARGPSPQPPPRQFQPPPDDDDEPVNEPVTEPANPQAPVQYPGMPPLNLPPMPRPGAEPTDGTAPNIPMLQKDPNTQAPVQPVTATRPGPLPTGQPNPDPNAPMPAVPPPPRRPGGGVEQP
jgi:hypothetical protein